MLQLVLEHQNILLKPASLWNGLIKRARDSELIGWVRNSFWLNPKCGQDWLMRICLELSDLCIFLSAVILPGLRFGAGTRTIPWWTCYHLRARTEAQKRHQSTHTNRQTDGWTLRQRYRHTGKHSSKTVKVTLILLSAD